MRHFRFTQRLSLFAVLPLVGLGLARAADPAAKAKNPAAVQVHLGKLQVDPAHVKVHKRTAIAHKPLEMLDPKTGAKLAADKLIDLPSGKKVKAASYFAEINKLEKKFNEIGYTLRDRTNAKVVLQQSHVDEKELGDQSKKLTTAHLAFNPQTMRAVLKRADLEKKHLETQKQDADRVKNLAQAAPAAAGGGAAKPAQTVKTWSNTLGKKGLVTAYLNTRLESKGSPDEVSFQTEASAGGTLIGKDLNVVKANCSISSQTKGTSRANLHVYLLGQHVINLDKSGTTAWNLSDSKTHSIDVHSDFHFSIGPIPMSARLGAKGSAGIRYLLAVRPAHATVQVIPFVDARVYVQAAVDLGMVSGGGKGELVLLKSELRIGADLDVNVDPAKGPYFAEHVYAHNQMDMLSGKISAWAKVSYFIGSHEWHYDLWSWKGLKVNGYLFNEQRTTYLTSDSQSVAQTK
jgi:hypothetical protein